MGGPRAANGKTSDAARFAPHSSDAEAGSQLGKTTATGWIGIGASARRAQRTPMACGGAELEPCTDGAGSSTAAAHLAPHRPAESECVSSRPRLCQSSWAPHSRIGTLVRPRAGRSAERQRLLPKRQGVPQCKRAARPEPNKEDPSEGVLFDSGATGGIAARALALAGGLSAPILGGGACRRNSVRRSRSRSPGA